MHVLGSDVAQPSTSKTGVLELLCFLWKGAEENFHRQDGNTEYPSITVAAGEDAIHNDAKILQDQELLAKISGKKFDIQRSEVPTFMW